MADILIKGMEMPTDGHWGTVSIPFYIHGDGSVSDSKGHIIGSAVPIPPHGRLGDLDALVDWLKLSYGTSIPIVRGLLFSSIIKEIQEYPSVIPTEEGKQL